MQKSTRPGCSGVLGLFPRCFRVVSVALFSFLFGAAVAQEPPPDAPLTILITASRFAETVDETLAPVTVITRKEIEEKQASTVEEVLRAVPGVTFGNDGGVGKNTSLFLRGTESNHVLVLIDGVKAGGVTDGRVPFQHLPLDLIEKIEVVRGPRSSLYGSEAIGGVIQIFTRKGGARPSAEIGGGSHNAKKWKVATAGGDKDKWFNASAAYFSTNGFDACTLNFCRPGAGDATGDDHDGYRNQSIALRGGVHMSDALSLEGNFIRANGDTEFDGFYNEVKSRNSTRSIKATFKVDEQFTTSLLLGESGDKSRNFNKEVPARVGKFNTTRKQAKWKNDFRWNANNIIVTGADYLKDALDSTNRYADANGSPVEDRDNKAVFGLWRSKVNLNNDFELSVRNDKNEQFGGKTTGSVAWGRKLTDTMRTTATYGSAFTVPSFNDLYFPALRGCFGVFKSNPALKPEESKTLDVGVSGRSNNGRWAVNAYQTQIRNLIENSPAGQEAVAGCSGDVEVTQTANINKARVTGIELTRSLRFGALNMTVTATWQDAQNRNKGADKNKPLLRRPRSKLDLDFSYRHGIHRLGANIYAQGQSEDNGGRIDIPGFATLNLRGEFRIDRDWSFGVKVNNVLDKKHQTVNGYPQDGSNFMATLRYAPNGGR